MPILTYLEFNKSFWIDQLADYVLLCIAAFDPFKTSWTLPALMTFEK